HGGVRAYDLEGKNVRVFKGRGAVGGVLQPATPEGIGAGAAAPPFAYRIYPARLLVVTATFPYKEQMELYQKALRFEKLDEVVTRNAMPEFRGLIVHRRVVRRDGTPEKWEPLYTYDPKTDKMVANPQAKSSPIQNLLKQAAFDEENVYNFGEFMPPGAVA